MTRLIGITNGILCLMCIAVALSIGCKSTRHDPAELWANHTPTAAPVTSSDPVASENRQIDSLQATTVSHRSVTPEYPQPNALAQSTDFVSDPNVFAEPRTHLSGLPDQVWSLSLDEAIEIALLDTRLLRSLGGAILSNPQSISSRLDPAIQRSDPNFGVEAALSQFDAQFQSSLNFAKNDDVFNNAVIGGGAREVRDDVTRANYGLRKTNGFGTQFSIDSTVAHSDSSNPNLLFPHSWTTTWEASIRQPLLQGRGARFNQIAGPATTPGQRNASGVLISRLNHELSIVEFESGLIEMIDEVIGAYWELELAYRNFESIRAARDLSLSTWHVAKARYNAELPGGEADREAQAREQYYRFESQLLGALNGNARSGQVGILEAEANLRRLLNLPTSDGRLIKPTDSPVLASLVFDYQTLASSAVCNRVELRQQQQQIQRREYELIAARNFLLPRLDALVTYRNNGFGDDLAGGDGRFSSAWRDSISGDHREMEFGINYELPVGFRQAHAGVRNAKLTLARERVVLENQRQQVLHQLGNAYRRIKQIHADLEFLANRVAAAKAAVDSRQAAYQADAIGFDQLLDAQERLLQAELAFFQGTANYEAAKTELQRESGILLGEHGIVVQALCETD